MERSLKLMNNILHKIRSEERAQAESWEERERGKQEEVIRHASFPCKSDVHI